MQRENDTQLRLPAYTDRAGAWRIPCRKSLLWKEDVRMERTFKRVLSLLVAVVMVVSMIPANVFAEENAEYIAYVGEQGYETLQAAVDAATAGATVTLAGNVVVDETVTIEKSLTLDGKGFKLTPADPTKTYDSAIMAGASGWGDDHGETIKLVDLELSGWTTIYGVVRVQGVTFEMERCTLSGNTVTNSAYGVRSLNFADAAIKNSVFRGNKDKAIDINFNGDGSNAEVVIDKCQFTDNESDGAGIVVYNDGAAVTVSNSTFDGNKVSTSGNAAVVYLGFNDNAKLVNCVFNNNTVETSNASTKRLGVIFGDGCVINGNAFVKNTIKRNGEAWSVIVSLGNYYDFINANISANYWDGKVPSLGDNYLDEYEQRDIILESYYQGYTNGTLSGLTEITNNEAEIDGVGYATLEEALADAVANGGYITLLRDVEVSGELALPAGKTLTIDGNGHKLTPAQNFVKGGHGAVLVLAANDAAYSENSIYTIKNLTFEGFNGLTRVVRANFCDAVLENCTFTGNAVSEGVITSAYANLSIKDCAFNNNTSDFAVINIGSDVSTATALAASITGSSFTGNKAGIAVAYLASSANVIGNVFKDNEHTGTNANGAAVLAGPYAGGGTYAINITDNAFVNAMGDKPAVFAEDWSDPYGANTAFDLSSNYWNGAEPAEGGAYKTSGTNPNLKLDDYYASFENGELGTLVKADLQGSGTEADPYLITCLEDLIFFRNSVNAGETKYNAKGVWVALAANIDMTGVEWIHGIGDGINATFDGCFDGNGYTISNLTMTPVPDSDGYLCGGLFGYIYQSGVVIRDLTIENATVDCGTAAGHNVGILVGFANRCTDSLIENVTIKGNVKIEAPNVYGVGAIVGYSFNNGFVIKNCTVDANDGSYIKGYSFVGGIIGYGYQNSTITGCSVKNVDIIATSKDAGGVAGLLLGGSKISGCTVDSSVTVTAPANVGTVLGAIASEGIIVENCNASEPMVGGSYSNSEPAQAKIGDKYYTSLEAALAAAKAGDTITLLAPYVVEAGETVVLDLKGVTIVGTPTEAAAYAMITNKGNLTITDSVGGGKILCEHKLTGSTAYAVNTIVNGGTLTIQGGTIENKSTATNQIGYAIDNNSTTGDAILVIEGGKVTVSGSYYYDGIRLFCNNLTKENSVTVSGGEVSSIWLQNPSDGATDRNTKDVKGSVTITDGKVGALYLEPSTNFEGAITGGEIGSVSNFETADGRDLTGFISGGTFGQAVAEAYCAEGYIPVKNADNTFGVKVGEYVAQVGEDKFESLQDAIDAAQNGETVILLEDIELTAAVTVPAGKTLVIDLCGKTVTYTSTVQGEAMITNKGTLTVNDSSDAKSGVIYYNYIGAADTSFGKGNYTISNAGTLTVNGGKITIADLSRHAKYPIDNNSTTGDAVLVINGGHLYNYNTSAIRQFCNSTTYQNSVTINGGLIEGFSAIWMQNPGKNTVNGTLTITGGEIKTTAKAYVQGTASLNEVSSSIYFTIDGTGGAWSEDSFVTITGGTFNENVKIIAAPEATISGGIFNGNVTGDVAEGFISGGTFSNPIEEALCADGYIPMDNGDGTYGVKVGKYVARVNGVGYETVTEAINQAQDGDVVQLLPGVISEQINPWGNDSTHAVEKSITIVGAENFGTTLTGGLCLGYDDNGCRAHTITIKGIHFDGMGVTVAGQQNVIIDGNKFTNITAPVYSEQSANANAISVIGKDVNATITNNMIDGTAVAGINLRNIATATVTGNTVTNTQHNAITLSMQTASVGTVKIEDNIMSNWGLGGEGRAVRVSGGETVELSGNVMVRENAPEEFVKITGFTQATVDENYWSGKSPIDEGVLDVAGTYPANYYGDEALQNLIPITYAAQIGDVYYLTLKDAVDAAKTGAVIKLLVNGETVVVGKELTIEMNGFTASVSATPGLTVVVENDAYVVKEAVAVPTVTASNVISTGKPMLTWDKVEGAVKYEVYRATSKDGTYSWMYTTTDTSYVNTLAVAGNMYYYKVRAIGSSGTTSAFSTVVSRTCDCAQPTITVSNRASDGKPMVTWEAVPGAVKYEVYRATSKDGTYSWMYTTTDTSYVNTLAVAGNMYYYKVRAIGSSGTTSAFSTVVSRTCDCAQPTITVSNRASDGKPMLTWEAVPGAVKYEIYRATSKDGSYSLMYTTTATSYVNTLAVAGNAYYYKVRAIGSNSGATSAFSTVVSRTCDCAQPVVTVSYTSSGNPKLTWEAVPGAVKYEIYRATSKDGTYSRMYTTTNTSYVNTSVTAGKTYYYKVIAYGSTSNATSAASSIVSAKYK